MASPKIIDFGVAKATQMRLTEQTVFTEHGQLIGTPEYMSPEQAEMSQQDIDTCSDVYSLGVVLYELLTGSPPFESKSLRSGGLNEIRRIIREVEPPRPSTRVAMSEPRAGASGRSEPDAQARDSASHASHQPNAGRFRTTLPTLIKQLRTELEWIPLKALRKDRSERYRSATELGDDIRNYLAGRPLIAGPESAAYRLRKFVRRNRGAVAAGSVMLVLLVAGLLATSMTAGWALRERGDAIRARLDACPRRLRGIEWRLLEARSDPSIAVIRRHASGVNSATFDRLGNRIVTASDDGTARVFEAETGRETAVFLGHAHPVRCASFDDAADRVVSADEKGGVFVWDGSNGQLLAKLRGHGALVLSAAFSPSGEYVLTSAADGTARIWDAVTGRPRVRLRCGGESEFVRAQFSPNGDRVVTAGREDSVAHVWSAESGQRLLSLRGHETGVTFVAFSPHGDRIVTTSHDKTARVWDASTGTELRLLKGHEGRVLSAVFNQAGDRILTWSRDQTARIWDTATGREMALFRVRDGEVERADFSKSGERVITHSYDGTMRLWAAGSGEQLAVLRGHEANIRCVTFSPNGERLITASADATVRVWDSNMRDDSDVLRFEFGTSAVVFSAARDLLLAVVPARFATVWSLHAAKSSIRLDTDAGRISAAGFTATGDRIVTTSLMGKSCVWDSATGAEVARLDVPQFELVRSVAFDRDGTRVATSSFDGTTRVWSSKSGKLAGVLRPDGGWFKSTFSRPAAEESVRTVDDQDPLEAALLALRAPSERLQATPSFSPTGDQIVTTSNGPTAQIWDADRSKRRTILSGHSDRVYSAAFDSSGQRVVTASRDRTARLWDAFSGAVIATLRGHDDEVWWAGFSATGDRIITLSRDRTVRLWSVATGKELVALRGHEGPVRTAMLNAPEDRLLTASTDQTARVWDPATGRELLVLRGHDAGLILASFTRDGTRIVTASQDGTARIWDSIPNRIRHAERLAHERGEDGDAIVRAYLEEVTRGPSPPP